MDKLYKLTKVFLVNEKSYVIADSMSDAILLYENYYVGAKVNSIELLNGMAYIKSEPEQVMFEFETNDIVEFKDKDSNDYHKGAYKIEKLCKAKNQTSGWVESVIYTDVNTGETYVKSKSEFASQFKKKEK